MWLDNSAECREEGCVNVITWNLAGRLRHIPQQVERLASRAPDLVALQEVRWPGLSRLRTLLADGGLIHQADSFEVAPCPIHGHDRLCWVSQKCMEQRSFIRRLEVRETKYISLETLTRMVLEIERRDLTNRVNRDEVCAGGRHACGSFWHHSCLC
jgi:hypothetical protein